MRVIDSVDPVSLPLICSKSDFLKMKILGQVYSNIMRVRFSLAIYPVVLKLDFCSMYGSSILGLSSQGLDTICSL